MRQGGAASAPQAIGLRKVGLEPKLSAHTLSLRGALRMAWRPAGQDRVMSFIGEDPVAKGLAESLARPGGSATGVAMMAAELDGKRASLLHEFMPAARRIAIGTVGDASLTARIATVETATTTSGLVAIAWRASSGMRAGGPKCVVNDRLRPTTKPSRASSGICKSRIIPTAPSAGEITAMR